MNVEILIFVSTISAAVLASVLYKKSRLRHKVPPSLPWLPVVGSLPFLSQFSTFHLCLTEKAKRYGTVYSLYAGQRYAVVLNGHDVIREALVKRSADFAGRAKVYSQRHVWNTQLQGIGFRQYSDEFKMLRKISITVLKKLGFGERATMERKVQVEVNVFMKYIHGKKGEALELESVIRMTILNIVYTFLFGERFEADDPIGEYITRGIVLYNKSMHPMLDLFPIVRFLPTFKKLLKDIVPESKKWKQVFNDKIAVCLNTSTGDENFVTEFHKQTEGQVKPSELYYVTNDFIQGGTEPSSNAILWAIMLIGNHYKVQKRLHEEIDSVVSRERMPSFSDKLSYLEATILEIMRLKIIAPLALPHTTLCDTEVAGFFIPNDTQVIVNLWSAHMDPTIWPEPYEFRPERFIDDAGKVINRDRMISFSLGKRSCPGEILARFEIHLFLAALLQQFDIFPEEGQKCIPDHGSVSITYTPDPFKVRLLPRACQNA